MRELVGRLLGIGMCDGKQLVRQLNRFDFTHAEVRPAARPCSAAWKCGDRSRRVMPCTRCKLASDGAAH